MRAAISSRAFALEAKSLPAWAPHTCQPHLTNYINNKAKLPLSEQCTYLPKPSLMDCLKQAREAFPMTRILQLQCFQCHVVLNWEITSLKLSPQALPQVVQNSSHFNQGSSWLASVLIHNKPFFSVSLYTFPTLYICIWSPCISLRVRVSRASLLHSACICEVAVFLTSLLPSVYN